MLNLREALLRIDLYADGELITYPTIWNLANYGPITNRPTEKPTTITYDVRHAHYAADGFQITLTGLTIWDRQWLYAPTFRISTYDGQPLNPMPIPWRCWIPAPSDKELPGSVDHLLPGLALHGMSVVPQGYNPWRYSPVTAVSYLIHSVLDDDPDPETSA